MCSRSGIRQLAMMSALFQDTEQVNAKGDIARGDAVLKDAVTLYEEANDEPASKRLEIVFVSSDKDEIEFKKYSLEHHGAWWAIPYPNEALLREIKIKYEVAGRNELGGLGLVDRKGGLPTLLIVDAHGNAIDYEGVQKVQEKGIVALEGWEKQIRQ